MLIYDKTSDFLFLKFLFIYSSEQWEHDVGFVDSSCICAVNWIIFMLKYCSQRFVALQKCGSWTIIAIPRFSSGI